MNIKRFSLSILACFAFIFLFEWIFHGILLKDLYVSTADLWRTEEEMIQYFHWALFSQLWFVTAFAWVFTQCFENHGIKEGIRFGLGMGLVMGAMTFGFYPYMPIPIILALAWVVGSLLEGVLLGIILSKTYKN